MLAHPKGSRHRRFAPSLLSELKPKYGDRRRVGRWVGFVPVIARELAVAEVGLITTPGTHAVGGVTGLCLQVAGSGARSWLLRIKVDSKRREFGLGSFPTVALPSARDRARALRERIGGGLDPAIQRRTARSAELVAKSTTITFKACTEAFIGAEVTQGRNARYVAQTLRDLERLAFPAIGGLSVHSINPSHVLTVLEPIWHSKHATATKLRGHIERVLAFAATRGFREDPNPAQWGGNLVTALAAPNAVRRGDHHPSLPVNDVPHFIAQLRQMPGVAAQALELAILTATRPTDVRAMSWDELDTRNAVWTIPEARATSGRPHRVPLSTRATMLITSQPRDLAQQFVFCAPRSGGPLSDMALTAVVRRMNELRMDSTQRGWTDPGQGHRVAVPNGFRTTFRAWAEQKKYAAQMIDQALAPRATEQTQDADAQARQLRQRTALLSAWDKYCDSVKLK